MYLLPIAYLGFAMRYDTGYVKPMEGLLKMLFVVDMNNMLPQGFAMVWLVMTIVMLGFCVKNVIGRWRICKSNFDDGASLAQTEFERIKKQLGIKENVILLRNDNPRLQSPFVTGVFRRKVVVPYENYSKSELAIILYHELNHIKKSDVIFRYLTMLAIIINSINPLAYLLWSQVLIWSEADCDARALDALEQEDVTKKEYYDIIWQMMQSEADEPTIFYHPMLLNSKNSLYRRMEIMEKYRANARKTAKIAAVAWVMVVAMLSTVTAHAAGAGLAEAGDSLLQESQIIEQDGAFEKTETWSEEMTISANSDAEIIYMNDAVVTLGQGTIDWDVPIGTRCVSASIYLAEGTEVDIVCSASPTDCTYWFGLMHASSSCTVVEGSGAGSHTFTVSSSGYYRIMVENRSSQEISVVGGYTY